MKCSFCQTKNIKKAYYCKKCGEMFTEKEREKASKKGFIAFIKRLEHLDSIRTLSIITDHILFKTASIVLLLGIGIYNFYKVGNQLRIEENEQYTFYYNQKEDEYYIFMNEVDINQNGKLLLDLYIPNKIKNLDISYYDENNKQIYTIEVPTNEQFEFVANTDKNNYYVINSNSDSLKAYIYYPLEGEKNE